MRHSSQQRRMLLVLLMLRRPSTTHYSCMSPPAAAANMSCRHLPVAGGAALTVRLPPPRCARGRPPPRATYGAYLASAAAVCSSSSERDGCNAEADVSCVWCKHAQADSCAASSHYTAACFDGWFWSVCPIPLPAPPPCQFVLLLRLPTQESNSEPEPYYTSCSKSNTTYSAAHHS